MITDAPLFTHRYGVHDPDDAAFSDLHPWNSRHNRDRGEERARHWCRCPGLPSMGTGHCAQAVTQEDGLCDECRHWCVAIDRQDRYHLIADLTERLPGGIAKPR